MDPNIKFTIEIEEFNELSFLDEMLLKNLSNLTLEHSLYRNVNKSNSTIPFESTSPFNYKLAPFNFYIRRAFSGFYINHLENEFNTIRHIAIENDFPNRIIGKLNNLKT